MDKISYLIIKQIMKVKKKIPAYLMNNLDLNLLERVQCQVKARQS